MGSRLIPVVLLALLAAIHAQLWTGRGSVPNVRGLQQKIKLQNTANDKMRASNEQLASDIADLQEGLTTVEEKARSELGMVKPNEVFVQFTKKTPAP